MPFPAGGRRAGWRMHAHDRCRRCRPFHGILLGICWGLTLAPAGAAVIVDAGRLAVPPVKIGEHLYDRIIETPHPYPGTPTGELVPVWTEKIQVEDAGYLVLEFKLFHLAPGDRLDLHDGSGRLLASYRGRGFREKGGGFITPMVQGREARLTLYSSHDEPGSYGYRIERITRGFKSWTEAATTLPPQPESICGVDDQIDAACYAAGYPEVFESTRPVARVLMDGISLCTAWVVSCENHLLTANHCTWSGSSLDTQDEVDRMEFQFLYQDATCGGDDATVGSSFLGGTWLEHDVDLDYALIKAPAGEDPAATYGWLALDDQVPVVDQRIYIAGHPGGRPKEISLHSTEPADQDNPDGICEIASLNEPACVGGSVGELGYYCDTDGGGSGSPVISLDSKRVLALHHCPDCPNRGVPAVSIWQHNQSGAHPLPPCALFSARGSVRLDRSLYGCSDVVTVTVEDASLTGAGQVAVEVTSSSETLPETLVLVESGAGTGTFAGSLPTTILPPSAGDNRITVTHGDSLLVRYLDADDGRGGLDVPREITAAVACTGPALTQVGVRDVLGSSATVTWQSDRPADSTVSHAVVPPTWIESSQPDLVTGHEVHLAGLDACSDYLFQVSSRDEAGNLSVDDRSGLYHRLTTGVDVLVNPVSTDTPLPVADRTSTFSIIQVTADQPVVDVNVTVNIDHLYDGDLELYLRGPGGVEVALSRDKGGDGDHYTATVFDDEAAVPILMGSAPFTGSYRPEEPLTAFDGATAAGTWVLRVFDDEIGDTGILQGWSLTLMLPAGLCGAHASAVMAAVVPDTCPSGGPGDDDGILDAGESIQIPLSVRNDGTDLLTGVQVSVSPLTAGVTVPANTRLHGDLAAGAVSDPGSGVSAHLPENLVCGQEARFLVEISSDQGAWVDLFVLQVGFPVPAAGLVLDEDFDLLGIPSGWTVVDGGATADSWYTDSPDDPGGCASPNPRDPMGGMWAAVDSDCAGEVAMDEALISPVLDLSLATAVTLEFDHHFRRDAGEVARVDVRSLLTGGAWVNVASWVADTVNPEHVTLDITAMAAGAADVSIRWHYDGATFAWYWYVDNVLVSFTAPGGCLMDSCPTGSPPGEQAGVAWSGPRILAWDGDPAATLGCRIHRGTLAEIFNLTGAGVESCLRAGSMEPGVSQVDLATDLPAPGTAYWYLITGCNDVGEGSAGAGTVSPRIINSTGDCP